jgi:hypothetical protein
MPNLADILCVPAWHVRLAMDGVTVLQVRGFRTVQDAERLYLSRSNSTVPVAEYLATSELNALHERGEYQAMRQLAYEYSFDPKLTDTVLPFMFFQDRTPKHTPPVAQLVACA